ncbi:MAG: hypothetical protein Q9199_003553 [Rusavskia elegans]
MANSCHSSPKPSPNEQSPAKDKTSKKNVNPILSPPPHKTQPVHPLTTNNKKAYTFHAYGRTEGVAGIIISDPDYPALVAHQLLSKVVDEFLSRYPRTAFVNGTPTLDFPPLKEYIVKYQDPQQADSIMKIQKELDETKIVLHKTIESVLERGEKIDSLVEKSDGLSAQSEATEFVLCDHVSRARLVSVRSVWGLGQCIGGQLRHKGVRILGIRFDEIMK